MKVSGVSSAAVEMVSPAKAKPTEETAKENADLSENVFAQRLAALVDDDGAAGGEHRRATPNIRGI